MELPTDGEYYISLRYAAGAAGNWNEDRVLGLSINNEGVYHVKFKSISQSWDVWSECVQKVSLKMGMNTVTYMCLTENDNSDCINLDRLSVWPYDTNPTITHIVFGKSTYIVSKNYTIRSKIFQVDSNGVLLENIVPVVFSSSNSSIMVVDEQTGVIKGIREGIAVIQAKSNGFCREAVVRVEANPSVTVDFASITRTVESQYLWLYSDTKL